jgi:DNA-binding transcriptional LysR family regulator
MMPFDDAQLRRLDLTLLLVFEEVMASGKLSAAAKRVGLTQSAVSHALKRLREIFGDELFIRTPRGVLPTPRARVLRGPLAEALRLIGGAVRPPRFDPESSQRVFRIAATDYETALFAPHLLRADAATTSSRFVFRTLVRREAIDALDAGDIDLLLGYTWKRGEACDAITLYEEDYLVVAKKGHPAVTKPLTLAQYAGYRHVLVSPTGSLNGIVDKALADVGRTRRVILAVPYFFAALATVARTELIATLPSRVARFHAANFGLGTRSPPVPIRSFPVQMVWSKRLGDDPALAWLRDKIQTATKLAQ